MCTEVQFSSESEAESEEVYSIKSRGQESDSSTSSSETDSGRVLLGVHCRKTHEEPKSHLRRSSRRNKGVHPNPTNQPRSVFPARSGDCVYGRKNRMFDAYLSFIPVIFLAAILVGFVVAGLMS